MKVKMLKHNDKVILNGKRGSVGTVTGYSLQYNRDPIPAMERALKNKHELFWINQEAACICSSPGYYDRQEKIWSNAVELNDGDTVFLDGKLLTVKYKGDYSDMASFEIAHNHEFKD
jgi:hypothetical protein